MSWVPAHLIYRKEYVKINSHYSDVLPLSSRVAQGGVYGPLLLFIYCNYVVDVVAEPLSIRPFADDYMLFNNVY